VRDSKSEKPKTEEQHEEDENWLEWAINAALKYGPLVIKAIEAAL
jgi:hypothetical protein